MVFFYRCYFWSFLPFVSLPSKTEIKTLIDREGVNEMCACARCMRWRWRVSSRHKQNQALLDDDSSSISCCCFFPITQYILKKIINDMPPCVCVCVYVSKERNPNWREKKSHVRERTITTDITEIQGDTNRREKTTRKRRNYELCTKHGIWQLIWIEYRIWQLNCLQ